MYENERGEGKVRGKKAIVNGMGEEAKGREEREIIGRGKGMKRKWKEKEKG